MTYSVEFTEVPKRKYTIDGQAVPSVTQILGVLDKPGLPWWGMQIGVQGVIELAKRHDNPNIIGPETDPDKVVAWLTSEKLTVNHQRDNAAKRGTGVHDALEQYCATGAIPSLSDFPVEERGFVQALCKFLIDHEPQPERTEVIVGSREHQFAGRYDLRCTIAGRNGILDLKTGKRLYNTVHLQASAYELADTEMGAEPCEVCWALRASADGSYELVETRATTEDFLAVKHAYDALARLKDAMKAKAAA